jgi:hypothetical protein
MASTKSPPASSVLLDELFEAGDDRFLDELFACTTDSTLKALAPRWMRDARPWARRALLRYVDDGCDRPRHRVLVKALVNLAEEREDDELMAHLLHAFDGLVRHEKKARTYYDWRARQNQTYTKLVRVKPAPGHTDGEHWRQGRFAEPRFRVATRRYLRRRAYRWFRKLGARHPERFTRGVLVALALYRDEELGKPEHILDVYGLSNLLYYHSDVLERDIHRLRVAPGRTLAELTPAPLHPDAWRGRADELLRLLFRSDCLLVRRFLVAWLEREEIHALEGLDARKLRPLVLSPHADVRAFAVRRLEGASGLGTLSIDVWMELLALDDLELLPLVCRLVEAHVEPSRLDLAQKVRLACARAAPVAELGFRWLTSERIATADALTTVMPLANAEAPLVREKAARWLLELVRGPLGTASHLRELIDARHADVRAEALRALSSEPRFADEPSLWLAASESPYPDVIAFLVPHLDAREKALPKGRVEHLFALTLLSVHRGSRQKRLALRQIAERIVKAPDRADTLVPLLRVALRSVREPERRSALAAVCRAAFERPALRAALSAHVPELTLFADEGRA